jgi:transcriptional regulator with GAF, ATPase, and Fis domain
MQTPDDPGTDAAAEDASEAATSSDEERPRQDTHVVPLRVARRGAAAAFEREYVRMILDRSGGNITRAAALAEVSRQMIQKLMRKYGL